MSADVVEFGTGVSVDDDDEIPRTLADRIRAQIAARKARTFPFTHPDVPEWKVIYRLPVDRSELAPFFERAEKAAKRKQKYSFDAAVLATLMIEMSNMGETVADSSGNLTVRDPSVMTLLGADSPSEAIRVMYGSDGIVAAVAEKLMSEAGYGSGDEVLVDDAEDPTNAG